MDQELQEYLKKNNIEYKIHEHPEVFTVEQSNLLVKNVPGKRAKNLFLKDEKGKYYLVCMPGEKRLNIKSLKSHLEVSSLFFASPEELKEELNISPGSVSIFSLIYSKKTRLILDKELWDAQITGFHPNINTATLEINHNNLEKFYNSLNCSKEVIYLE